MLTVAEIITSGPRLSGLELGLFRDGRAQKREYGSPFTLIRGYRRGQHSIKDAVKDSGKDHHAIVDGRGL